MKTRFIFLAILLISVSSLAQNGINYKAIVKDGSGNIVINDLIQVEFNILQGLSLTIVYTETHSPTTDANGFIILNIGEGIPVSGVFDDIDWGSDRHFLDVQINTGGGLVDMGTTEFKTVPYALDAANVSGLETLDEGNGVGWRLKGKNPEFYGPIGSNAVDFSRNLSASATRGATGGSSFATGNQTIASGAYSFVAGFISDATGFSSVAMGSGAEASGNSSIAIGGNTNASGEDSFAAGAHTTASGEATTAMGRFTIAESYNSVAIGRFNLGGGNATAWNGSDPLFEVGRGSGFSNRANAMTILKNGNVGIGTHTPQELLHISGGRLRIGTETIEDTGSNRLSFNADLLPDVNNTTQLGNANFRWLGLWAADGTINTSDRRDKTNINDLNYGLEEVLKMQPVSFNWKNRPNEDTKLGLIAQELVQIIPEVVKTHDWQKVDENDNSKKKRVELDRMGVYYSDLIPVLVKAIQELKQENDTLRLRIENLEN